MSTGKEEREATFPSVCGDVRLAPQMLAEILNTTSFWDTIAKKLIGAHRFPRVEEGSCVLNCEEVVESTIAAGDVG